MLKHMSYLLEGRDVKSITDDELVEAWNYQASDTGDSIDAAHVARFISTVAVKMDLSVEAEVANMEFVLERSCVKLPHLYKTFSKGVADYFVMEYVN